MVKSPQATKFLFLQSVDEWISAIGNNKIPSTTVTLSTQNLI